MSIAKQAVKNKYTYTHSALMFLKSPPVTHCSSLFGHLSCPKAGQKNDGQLERCSENQLQKEIRLEYGHVWKKIQGKPFQFEMVNIKDGAVPTII